MNFNENPFEDPAWLRTMLWLLVNQQGGSVTVNLAPAIVALESGTNEDLGHLAARYDSETQVCLMTKAGHEASQLELQFSKTSMN